MASNKNKQENTNSVAWSAPPPTAASDALQTAANTSVDYATPIRNSYARAEQGLNRSFQNPLGAYTTADVRDKSLREQNQALNQSEGMDLSNAAQDNSQGQFYRKATVAQMLAPQMYQSASTQSQKWTTGDTLGLVSSLGGGALS